MRKLNSILGASLIVLLLIHMVTGALQLTGLMSGGAWIRSVLSFIMMTIVIVHAIIGVILTVRTIKDSKGGGERYFKQNKRFWLSRISGLAMMILILYHVLIFSGKSGDTFRLNMFGGLQMAAHILLLLALLVHLMTNIKPLFIALGIENRKYIADILIVLAIILLICAIAFLVYYLRWNVLWRYGS